MERIGGWLISHAILLGAIFFITLGAAFAFLNTPTDPKLSEAKRVLSQAISIAVVSLGAGYCIEVLHWNGYVVCFVGFFSGMGGDKLCRLMLSLYNESTSFPDFFRRLYRAYNAAKNVPPNNS